MIEVLVVMAIMAVIGASIGIQYLISNRNRLLRDQFAEDLASEIRLARSYALGATTVDTDNGGSFVPKAAVVKLQKNQDPEIKFLAPPPRASDPPCHGYTYQKRKLPTEGRGEIVINNPTPDYSRGPVYLIYASPYGRFYATTSDPLSFIGDINQSCKPSSPMTFGGATTDLEVKVRQDSSDTNGILLKVNGKTGEVTVKEP